MKMKVLLQNDKSKKILLPKI